MPAQAPQILANGRKSSKYDISKTVVDEFDSAYRVQYNDIYRGWLAQRRYFPINHGKFGPGVVDALVDGGHAPIQFDIASPKIDILAGSLVSDLPDPGFQPVNGKANKTTDAITKAFFADKSMFRWDAEIRKVFRDGLIHCGDMEVYEAYDADNKPYVAFGHVLMGYIIYSPYWLSDNDRDCDIAYRQAFMDPEKIMRLYDFATDEIKRAVEKWQRTKSDWPMDTYEQQMRMANQGMVGGEFQVIEKHEVKHYKTTRLIGRPRGTQEFIPFPDDAKEFGKAQIFAEINGIDLEDCIEVPYYDKIHYVTTVCRQLAEAEIQVEAKSKIQVQGLPFYHFTAKRWGGKNMGIIESLGEVEDVINKRERLVSELLETTSGGSQIANVNLFPTKKEQQDFAKNKNMPGKTFFGDLDSVKKVIEDVYQQSGNAALAALGSQIDRMFERHMPIISRVSDVLSSQSGPGSSALLFDHQYQTQQVSTTLLRDAMGQFLINLGEGYFTQFQLSRAGYEFSVPLDGEEKFTFNQRDESNPQVIYNDVSKLPRHRVVITKNQKSDIYKLRQRGIWAEMLKTINPKVATGYYLFALGKMIESLDLNEEDHDAAEVLRTLYDAAGRLDLVQKAANMQTGTQNATLQGKQIEMQLDRLNAQFQKGQPQQGNINPQSTAEGKGGPTPDGQQPTQPVR